MKAPYIFIIFLKKVMSNKICQNSWIVGHEPEAVVQRQMCLYVESHVLCVPVINNMRPISVNHVREITLLFNEKHYIAIRKGYQVTYRLKLGREIFFFF